MNKLPCSSKNATVSLATGPQQRMEGVMPLYQNLHTPTQSCSTVAWFLFYIWSHLALIYPFSLIEERKKRAKQNQTLKLVHRYVFLLFECLPVWKGLPSLSLFFTTMLWDNAEQRGPVLLGGEERFSVGLLLCQSMPSPWQCPWRPPVPGIVPLSVSWSTRLLIVSVPPLQALKTLYCVPHELWGTDPPCLATWNLGHSVLAELGCYNEPCDT